MMLRINFRQTIASLRQKKQGNEAAINLTAYATLEKKFLRDETQTMRVIGKSDVYKLISLFLEKRKESKSVTSGWKQFKKRGIPTITPIWILKPPHKIFKSVIIEEK